MNNIADIVIIGGGIGGIPMAFEMRNLLKSGEEITVVSNSSSFQFVPSNPWGVVDWRTPLRKTNAAAGRIEPTENIAA